MIKAIAFDADDTLWGNEHYFREAEAYFCQLLEEYMPQHDLNRELFRTEIDNMELYGYGIKPFTLSMIETALRVTDLKLPPTIIDDLISYGKEMLQRPVELLDGVEETLAQLTSKNKLVMATKGDLLDQERKLRRSGLQKYFHHIEIMSDKQEADYKKLITHLDILPGEFMMVGNSLRSDIIPVLNIGGYAVHVPYFVTWEHENVSQNVEHEHFGKIDRISELLKILPEISSRI